MRRLLIGLVFLLGCVSPARADIELGAYLGTLKEITSTTAATDYLAILRGTTLYKIKPGNITGSGITATLGADISIIMGDTRGSNKVKFLDSDSTEVGSINSDGTPTFGSSTGVVYSTAGAYAPTTTLSNIAIAVDTASRVVCSDASKNIKACDASTGTGAPVLATGPTLAGAYNTTPEVDGHAAHTLTAGEVSNTVIYNTGQTDDTYLTFPAAAAGYNALFTVGTTVAKYWGVRAGTNDKIYLIASNGTVTAGADNGYVRLGAAQIGQSFACWTFKTDSYDWMCKAISIGTSTFAVP